MDTSTLRPTSRDVPRDTTRGTAPDTVEDAPGDVPQGIDAPALDRWLTERLPGATGRLTSIRRLAGGLSNLTYLAEWAGRRLVVRRPPLGHVLATAHDMGREYRVMTALGPTAVPVPRTYGLCQDTSVLGAPFYVMEHVAGVTFPGDAELARVAPDEALRVTDALVDTLAALHTVDPAAVGLGDFGRPAGFMARQVRRWRTQWEGSRTREMPAAQALNDRLAASCPDSTTAAVVHGDYKLDNVLVEPGGSGRVVAVLDWEMSTLGDPLADLGMLCMYWDGFADVAGSPVATPAAVPGWPGRDHLVERYARQSRVPLDHLGWYTAFAFYKIAAILEGIHCRTVQGLTVGDGFDGIGDAVPLLIERGHALLDTSP
jgi:aminoglycoside phosphotransferase (APT) family kinase protein